MKNRNTIAVILAAVLLLSAFAGCAAKETAPSPEPEQSEAPVSEAPAETPPPESQPTQEAEPEVEPSPDPKASFPLFDQPTDFTIWTSSSPDLSDLIDDLTDYKIISEMEKLTNLHWDATIVSFTAQTEQFNLMVASQEYTDVCDRASSYSGGADQAVADEFLIDITGYVADCMPNLSAKYEQYPDLRKAVTTLNGNMCFFPKIYTQMSLATAGLVVRMDWMDDLGIDAPKTIDDFYNMLTKFKTEKGADAALIVAPSGVPSGSSIIGAYGISSAWYQVDGQVRYAPLQPEYKDYLTMMNKWYSEGLIWQDFYTQSTDRLMDFSTILTGMTGVWHAGVQDMSTLVKQSDEEGFRLGGLSEVTLDGGISHLGEEPVMLDDTSWAITTECDDPVSVCKYVDYLYSDEGVLLANYGVEGETFEYDENGKPYLTELVTNNPDMAYRIALNVYTCDRQTPVPYVIDQTKSLNDYSDDQLQAIDAWGKNSDYAYNMPSRGMNMTLEETNESTNIYSDISTYLEESIVKFIIGDMPISEFDTFRDKITSMNIDRVREIQQAAYDRYIQQ